MSYDDTKQFRVGGETAVFLHIRGRDVLGQRRTKRVLRVEPDAVVLENNFVESGEQRFSTTTGRCLKDDGSEHPWDGWRLKL